MVGILFITVIRISAVIVRGRVCMHALYIRFSKSLGARELVSSVRTKTEKETELFSEFKEFEILLFLLPRLACKGRDRDRDAVGLKNGFVPGGI